MKLENIVPWGRNLEEYKNMFLLSKNDLQSKILGCGDGPSSFNSELEKLGNLIFSIDPIYQFSKNEIQNRISETSSIIEKQLKENKNDYIWKNFSSVEDVVETRISAMKYFLKDYDENRKKYIWNELPNLEFQDNSFDLVLSSHFLFLYSKHFNLQFHKDSILEMCRVSKKEVRIFPIFDLENRESQHLKPILEILEQNNLEFEIIKTDYEFQKNANQMLRIKIKK